MADTSTAGRGAQPHILLAHDDATARRVLHLLLAGGGHWVKAYAAGAALLRDPGLEAGVCLVAAHRQPHLDGIDLLWQLRAASWNNPAILIASENVGAIEPAARDAGYAHVVPGPFAHHLLLGLVEGLLSGGHG